MNVVRKEETYKGTYTIDDIYDLPDGERAELIDGQIYYLATPSRTHQRILFSLSRKIADYIDSKGGNCEVDIAPFAVFLNNDDVNYVEPDISVICDKSKLEDKGCNGAPDWIVNPITKTVQIYSFDNEEDSSQFSFDDEIPVHIFDGLTIKISDLL